MADKLASIKNQSSGQWEPIYSGGIVNGDGTNLITPDKIGLLSELPTTNKTSIVNSLQELSNIRNNSTKEFKVEVRNSDPSFPEIGREWLRSDL